MTETVAKTIIIKLAKYIALAWICTAVRIYKYQSMKKQSKTALK